MHVSAHASMRHASMRAPARILCAAVSALLATAMAGCGRLPGYPGPPVPPPQDVLSFTQLYGGNCAACHGAEGRNGSAMNLANPEYQALVDDATLRKWISNGMPGTQMPAFARSSGGMLTDEQITSIIDGMRKQWLRPNAFAGATPPPYAQSQAGDAGRGRQVYEARCAICHAASSQQIASPAYLALVDDQTLRTFIIAGSPDIGQPDWRHDSAGGQPAPPLSSGEIDDIVAYLASIRNSAPAYATAPSPIPASAGGMR